MPDTVNEFRRLAAKMDQHMQQLAARGVRDASTILRCMIGYMPDLHRIWIETSDEQLVALCREFPEFCRYALVVEDAFDAERSRASRPYDGMALACERHRHMATRLLRTAATLERGYLAFCGSADLQVFQTQVNEMRKLHRQWLSDLETFKTDLREHGAEPRALQYVNEAFGPLAARLNKLADID